MKQFFTIWTIGFLVGVAVTSIISGKNIEGLRNANQTLIRESMNCGANLTEMEQLNKICNLEYME